MTGSWKDNPFFNSGTRSASPAIPLGVAAAVILFALIAVQSPEGLSGPDILSAVYPLTFSLLFRAHIAASHHGAQDPRLLRRVKSRSTDDFIPVADDEVFSDRSLREDALEYQRGHERTSVSPSTDGNILLGSRMWTIPLSTSPPLILRI